MTPRYDVPVAGSDQRGETPDAAALLRATRRIYRSKRRAELLRILLESAHELTACSRAAIFLLDASGALVCHDALPALPAPRHSLLPPDGVRMALIVADYRVQPAPAPAAWLSQSVWPDQPPLSVSVPIMGADSLRGLLVCAWSADDRRRAGRVETLGALADDAGQALSALDDQNRRAEGHQQILSAIDAVSSIGLLYSSLLTRLIEVSLQQILDATAMEAGAILLFDEQTRQLELASAKARSGGSATHRLRLWQPPLLATSLELAEQAARNGQTIISGEDSDSLVSVPLLTGGWPTGVLQVVPEWGQRPDNDRIQFLRILASQTAAAIENARLFTQTRSDQERTRAVVDATNDAILMLDERRQMMMLNRRARFFFGFGEHELIGKSYEQFSPMLARLFEDGARFNSWLSRLLHNPAERTVEEFRLIAPEPRLLQCYSAPVMDHHGRHLGRILVFRDITREHEVDRMKSDFIAIVSHELRTPLTSIQGTLQLVLGQPQLGRPGLAEGLQPRGRELLTISLNNTARLIRLINDVLDIAKIEQGRIQLRREALDPAALCRSAIDEVAPLGASREITIDLELGPALPAVTADRDRSVQVLVNLLSNAIKFSATGQQVVLSARRDGAMVQFAVRDHGRGIAPEDQAGLFQKFHQLDSSATRDAGGTGLGLAISRALVEEQGGRVWLESAPLQGSTFSFTLPVVKEAILGLGESPELADEGQPLALVVDDDPHVRPVLVRLLQRRGLRAAQASDGYSGLELAINERPDVILLDIQMPGIDGYEVLRRLRGTPATANMPVIILTASGSSANAKALADSMGADDYLEKPIAAERLFSAIDRALRQGRP